MSSTAFRFLDSAIKVLEKRLAWMGFAVHPITIEDVASRVPALKHAFQQQDSGSTRRPPSLHRLIDPNADSMLLNLYFIQGGEIGARLGRAEDISLPLKHAVPPCTYQTWPMSFLDDGILLLTEVVGLEGTSLPHVRRCLVGLGTLDTIEELRVARAALTSSI